MVIENLETRSGFNLRQSIFLEVGRYLSDQPWNNAMTFIKPETCRIVKAPCKCRGIHPLDAQPGREWNVTAPWQLEPAPVASVEETNDEN